MSDSTIAAANSAAGILQGLQQLLESPAITELLAGTSEGQLDALAGTACTGIHLVFQALQVLTSASMCRGCSSCWRALP